MKRIKTKLMQDAESLQSKEEKRQFEKLLKSWVYRIMHDEEIIHPLFAQAMQNVGEDILGEYFLQQVNPKEREKRGQIFTPWYVIDYINTKTLIRIRNEGTEHPYILDPACGSGRFIMDAIKKGFKRNLYAIDIDILCVLMSVINIWLMKPIEATITWGNFIIDADGPGGGGWVNFKIENEKVSINGI